MQVRAALMEDIDGMVELGKRGHALSASSHLAFDEAGAKLLGAQCICSKRLCAFVAVDGDKIVGVLLGSSDKLPYLKADYATDLVTYAERPGAGTKLLKSFISWAVDSRRVDQVILGVTFGGRNERSADALYGRLGFKRTGAMYVLNRAAGVDC